MRPIGFSTGALALDDFRTALSILGGTTATAVELSALRQRELQPLVEALDGLTLDKYSHISVHLPSSIELEFECRLLDIVAQIPRDWPLIAHPNIITTPDKWRPLGERLCIENMDKRKPVGQTARHLRDVFQQLPRASLCFDIGHAHQIDPTMGEAVLILEEFKGRMRQIHVSEVNSASKHDLISLEARKAFSIVSHLIPESLPAVLESRWKTGPTPEEVQCEIDIAGDLLRSTVLAG